MPTPPLPDPEKYCEFCGTRLARKRFPGGRLEDPARFRTRKTCGQSCGNSRHEVGKSGHHHRAANHRKDACERCGTTEGLHVHHRDKDFTNDDPRNLETLCGSCHLKHHWAEDHDERVAAMAAGRRG